MDTLQGCTARPSDTYNLSDVLADKIMAKVKINCVICGRERVYWQKAEREKSKYCSTECYRSIKKVVQIKCKTCDKSFKKYISEKMVCCSKECGYKYRASRLIKENHPRFKGREGKYAYSNLHQFIKRHKGKASECVNDKCSGENKNYVWANITDKYDWELDRFASLCRSCHASFDAGNVDLSINGKIIKKPKMNITFPDDLKALER